jgi:hypothetical protein
MAHIGPLKECPHIVDAVDRRGKEVNLCCQGSVWFQSASTMCGHSLTALQMGPYLTLCRAILTQQKPDVRTDLDVQQRDCSQINITVLPVSSLVVQNSVNPYPIQAQHSQYNVVSEQETHKGRKGDIQVRTTLAQNIVSQGELLVLTMGDESRLWG